MSIMATADMARARLRELDAIMVEDIIGPGEIRDLAGGVSRATFKNWREGRGLMRAGPFPQPIRHVSGVDLFDRGAVRVWLDAHR